MMFVTSSGGTEVIRYEVAATTIGTVAHTVRVPCPNLRGEGDDGENERARGGLSGLAPEGGAREGEALEGGSGRGHVDWFGKQSELAGEIHGCDQP